MKRFPEYSQRADRDLVSARNWYDRQRSELGDRFLRAVEEAVATVCERPNSFPLSRRNIRSIMCKKFPYRVYFRVLEDRIHVLAVYHTARSPRRWDDPNRN